MEKSNTPKSALGRIASGMRSVKDATARTLRNVADKLEGPKATFEVANVAIDFQFDLTGETVWATQAQMVDLFGRDKRTISEHIQAILNEGDYDEHSVVRKFRTTAADGKSYEVAHYDLDVILAVGMRTKSPQASAFRKWAFEKLRSYVTKGYALNEQRLRSDPEALQSLAERVRALRSEEKSMYAIVRDCFVISSSDYRKDSEEDRRFFMTMQEKFTYAASEHTSAELILHRADHTKPLMGMSTCPSGKPTLKDAQVGKNYLQENELRLLRLVSEAFLVYAEGKAMRGKTMTMSELLAKLDKILEFNEMPVFPGYKSFNARDRANAHAKQQLGLFNARVERDKYASAKTSALRIG